MTFSQWVKPFVLFLSLTGKYGLIISKYVILTEGSIRWCGYKGQRKSCVGMEDSVITESEFKTAQLKNNVQLSIGTWLFNVLSIYQS